MGTVASEIGFRFEYTSKFMSIKPEHISNIASRAKNHDYRRYLLPSTIHRIWFYTTAPISQIEYVASISPGKIPGEVPEDGGLGNEEFSAGKEDSKYAYEILDLWRLTQPISLKLANSKGGLKGPPASEVLLGSTRVPRELSTR